MNPQWGTGDGTVPDFSAKLPCDEGWADCHLVFNSDHGGSSVGQDSDLGLPGRRPDRLSRCADDAAGRRGDCGSRAGRGRPGAVRPYLATPDGTKAGVNPATGLVEEGIPGARLVLDAQDGAIALPNPGTARIRSRSAARRRTTSW